MTPDEERAVTTTLDALTRLMNLFQVERWVYLAGAVGGLGLGLWAATKIITSSNGIDSTQVGLLFGSSGILALTGARVAYFLNRSFNLVETVINRLMGVAPPPSAAAKEGAAAETEPKP